MSPGERTGGFTLIEVLLAVFVLSLTLAGFYADSVRSAEATGKAQWQARVSRLGERKMRELLEQAEQGALPEVGVSEEVFSEEEPPLRWRLTTERFGFPLPPLPETVGPELPSSVFASGNSLQGEQPSVLKMTLVVLPLESETADDGSEPTPFVGFAVEFPDPESLPEAVTPGAGSGDEDREEFDQDDGEFGSETGAGAHGSGVEGRLQKIEEALEE